MFEIIQYVQDRLQELLEIACMEVQMAASQIKFNLPQYSMQSVEMVNEKTGFCCSSGAVNAIEEWTGTSLVTDDFIMAQSLSAQMANDDFSAKQRKARQIEVLEVLICAKYSEEIPVREDISKVNSVEMFLYFSVIYLSDCRYDC